MVNILWELTLDCNLRCSFCISWERRSKSKYKITYTDAIRIIDNLPPGSHLSFIGGENFLFPRFMEILDYLDSKGMTYEITSNGTLIDVYYERLNWLKNLRRIYFSIDNNGSLHDSIRWYKWLFEKIVQYIPKITAEICVNTVILPTTKLEDIMRLNKSLMDLHIYMHRLSYNMNFSDDDIEKSILKINNLSITTRFQEKIDNENLRKKTILFYHALLYVKRKEKSKMLLDLHPDSLLKWVPERCKSIGNYYRINEYWTLSICQFIDNNFDNIIKTKFVDAIKNVHFVSMIESIKEVFPLDICKNCWKWC